MPRFSRAALAGLVVAYACAVSACTTGPGTAADAKSAGNPAALKDGRTVDVGVTTDLPGWGWLNRGDNTRSGFDIDMTDWLAKQIGFRPDYTDVTLSERETALQGGPDQRRVGLVVAVYSITDKRRDKITFAGPYMITRQGVMVREGDTRIKTVSDLAGKNVCTGTETTSLEQLENSGIDMTISDEEGLYNCLARLRDGTVDAVSADQIILAGMAQEPPGDLHVIPELTFGNQERYGLGLPLGSIEDCNRLVDELQNFIAKGSWTQFFKLHFDGLDPDLHRPKVWELDECK